MRRASCVAIALALAVPACSPFGAGAFHCERDDQCVDGARAGYCEEPVGFCAFDDSGCDSGRRFGASSGSVADQCVDATNLQVDAGTGDATSTVDADFTGCYGHGALVVCPVESVPAGGAVSIGVARLVDTTAGSSDCIALRAPGALDVCVIAGAPLSLGAAITATGPRPLVFLADGDLTVGSLIDLASQREYGYIAAGATHTPPTCSAGQNAIGGGGAGGSYGTAGADGGINMPGAIAQTAGPVEPDLVVAGGCPGSPVYSARPRREHPAKAAPAVAPAR